MSTIDLAVMDISNADNDGVTVVETNDQDVYRRYVYKNGLLHSEREAAIYTKYDSNVSKYYYLDGKKAITSQGVLEEHYIFHVWEYKDGKAIKIHLPNPIIKFVLVMDGRVRVTIDGKMVEE